MHGDILMLWIASYVSDEVQMKNQDTKIFKLIFLKTCAMVDRTL